MGNQKVIASWGHEMEKRTDASIDRTVIDVIPLFRGMWCVKTFCFCIRYPFENVHTVIFGATYFAETRFNNIIGTVKIERLKHNHSPLYLYGKMEYSN